MTLHWEAPYNFDESSTYEIQYKEKGKRWKLYDKNPERATVTVCNLQAETTYIFQVRVVSDDKEGPYSPESDEIQTKVSLASKLLELCSKVTDGPPAVYQLNSTENKRARNEHAKTRKFELGKITLFI